MFSIDWSEKPKILGNVLKNQLVLREVFLMRSIVTFKFIILQLFFLVGMLFGPQCRLTPPK
jgi:hypothetical protein